MGLFSRRSNASTHKPNHCVFTLDKAGVIYDAGSIGLQPTTLTISEHRVAVIGANGSGKTTLLQLLDGTLKPTKGTVLIDDGERGLNPTSRHDRRRIEELVGHVRREELPESYLRAKNVREALETTLNKHRIAQSDANAQTARLLAHFHLNGVASQPAASLNSEQRHLLAIVAALIASPSTIVADEPTKGLDEIGTTRVADALFAFGPQVIMATHDLSLPTNPRYAIERVLVLDEQEVTFDGEPAQAVEFYNALIQKRLESLPHHPAR